MFADAAMHGLPVLRLRDAWRREDKREGEASEKAHRSESSRSLLYRGLPQRMRSITAIVARARLSV